MENPGSIHLNSVNKFVALTLQILVTVVDIVINRNDIIIDIRVVPILGRKNFLQHLLFSIKEIRGEGKLE